MVQTINKEQIPHKKMNTGQEVPCMGFGTFSSGNYTAQDVADAVGGAIKCGYRMIDCAGCYGNEKEIGKVLNELIVAGVVSREELIIKSKLGNDKHRNVKAGCVQSIKDLQCGYLDVFYIHWPIPNLPNPNSNEGKPNPLSKPFSVEAFLDTYKQMEALVDEGLIRAIGVSNITQHKLELVWEELRIKPAMCQVELHPCFQQQKLYEFLKSKEICAVAYMPLGSPARPQSDVTPEDIEDLQQLEILNIAKKYGVHPAVIALKWAVQRGTIPIPFSVRAEKYYSNLKCITSNPLTEKDMEIIRGLEKNNRLGKGQVLLWESAKSWHELWDEE